MECLDDFDAGIGLECVRIAKKIDELMTKVDRWLCTLLDPDGRSFEERELTAKDGWPPIDVLKYEWGEDVSGARSPSDYGKRSTVRD
jgi:hypothetical protein